MKIGNIILPHRAVFGPMAGFTDAPCRRLMAQHGAGFTVSEMVSSRALVYGDHKTVSLLKAAPNGAPYGVQIFGEVPEIMGEATAAIEQYEFDFVDINMGCPAPKIVSGGAGSKLMLDPDRCGRIVEQVVAHTKRPVTVKMRKGWDADHITAVECAKACEQAGAALVAVHARTREQMYTPGIDPEIIARVKDAVRVPVLGFFNAVCQVYTTIIRGTPMMVQLLIMSMVIFANSRNFTMVGALALGINSGAYVSEIIRGGLMAVDPGQMEAGRSLGLNYLTTMVVIIIPQALRAVLPALGNEFIILLKDTSLITTIGGKELLYAAQGIMNRTYEAMFPLLGVALVYLLLVMLFSWLLTKFERRMAQGDR